MGIPATYRPDETSTEIFSEHTWLQGVFLACVAYGMVALLFFQCINLLLFSPGRQPSRWTHGLAWYIAMMFALSTIYIGALVQFTQESFIDGRNIPGGPNAFENEMFSIPIDMLANVTMVILSWFSDLINIWRCHVVYQSSSIPGLAVIALPVLMLLASIAFGILWLKQVGAPSSSPWDTAGINFTTPYFAMSLALNILVTILIVVRLMLYRRRINQALPSNTNHGAHYVSLAAMIYESAAIYSVFSLLFLVPFTIGHPLSQLFIQALSPVQIMSSLLIIFRIAQGKAWSNKTVMIMTVSEAFPESVQTIGGSNRNNVNGIHITTHTTTDVLEGRSKDAAISLQVLKEARSVDFDEARMNKEDDDRL
ncbi:hypothetical protein DFH08DRAFT_937271 [Mycena albidolilacea]|uniref:Uncharacterized protein n=1 Tax=Mycena albidolilacea TaxID=1033008 RepID=A0AAD7A024_9AGAR|nr:hypothetical protein DFH08DRAFT_937271 [Mycena albidolilacea]